MNEITMYGALWCKDTKRVIEQLNNADVTYTLLAIDDKELGQEYTHKVLDINNGKRITPTLVIDDENYTNPSNKELEVILENRTSDDSVTRCSNGKVLQDFKFSASELLKGGKLELEMGAEPNKNWGI